MREEDAPLNMRNWGRSRRQAQPGDLFRYLMPDGLFRFARLIRRDAHWLLSEKNAGNPGDANLVYLYGLATASDSLPPRAAFIPPRLLLPPQLTNDLAWLRGYFQYVAHWPLQPGEILARHCFYHQGWDRYLDDDANFLEEPIPPVGRFVLTGYAMMDLRISDVLGLPHAYHDWAKEQG
jgi:hypothetical protein